MDEPKSELSQQLRATINIKGKAKSRLAELPDGELWGVYASMRGGSQLTEIAKDLIDRGLIGGSHDGLRKLLARTRRRWLPFLCVPTPAPRKEVLPPIEY